MQYNTLCKVKSTHVPVLLFLLIGFFAVLHSVQAQEKRPQTPNFTEFVENKLKTGYKNITLEQICPISTNMAARRIFYDYGAIFVSNNGGKLPGRCIFETEAQVTVFQNGANPQTESIGGVEITLQKPAMAALLAARRDASGKRLAITPRGGSIAGSRSFDDTLRLWNSRFYPALEYWTGRRKISRQAAEDAKSMGIQDQVAQVLEWEDDGYYFSTGFNKSILYSVAAPGASQHIFMLALDVKQFGDKNVRTILNDNGWFQTVQSDLPHFTYLGVKETELPALGLKPVTLSGHTFWIPNV